MIRSLGHSLEWMQAAPLWRSEESRTVLRRPCILRFANDDFMTELEQALQAEDIDLQPFVAQAVGYRRPLSALQSSQRSLPTLRLYQPVHGHFNLVAANLVCRRPGLPDHHPRLADGERTAFVLRRLDAQGQELAWVGSEGKRRWLPVGDASYALEREEQFPLFPLDYRQGGRSRRLFCGLIPTASRETFAAAPGAPASPLRPIADPVAELMATLSNRVLRRIDDRRRQAFGLTSADPEAYVPPAPAGAPRDAADPLDQATAQEVSFFIVLDLADFLYRHLRPVYDALQATSLPADAEYRAVYLRLSGLVVAGGPSWRAALALAHERSLIEDADVLPEAAAERYDLGASSINLAQLASVIEDALRAHPEAAAAAADGEAGEVPKFAPDADGEDISYRLRCVYFRRNCRPAHPPLVSEPSRSFTISSFFDVEAPSRPIRIAMPAETSLAGLRKAAKNVSFMFSDKLREQMSAATDLEDAIDGKSPKKESFDLGEICSFSIPIITICAMIVLMIFIMLLNFVFWWLPLLRICFPIGLLAKLKPSGGS